MLMNKFISLKLTHFVDVQNTKGMLMDRIKTYSDFGINRRHYNFYKL